ncbi:MAG: TlpA family protein disulfide reductase [Sandaracinaceae bacterium]
MSHVLPVAAAAALIGIAATAYALDEGARAPEIGLTDLNGNRVTTQSLRGKVVLVDFWASWCEPCAEEMPVLERLYQRYRGQGFTVIAVSQDRTAANMRTFLGEHRVSFPVVHDAQHAVAGRYGPGTMPSSFIIDRRGVVRHIHAGYRSGDARVFEREIRALLEQ